MMTCSTSSCQFDERQVLVRGNVFRHALVAGAVLLVVNAVLQANGIGWASGFAQNLFIFFAVAGIASLEAILRGVFFTGSRSHWPLIWIYGLVGVAQLVASTSGLADTSSVVSRADHIVFAITGGLFIVIATVGGLKEVAERRAQQSDVQRSSRAAS